MTKADLVDQVVALGDLTRRDGEVIVETLFENIVQAMKADDKVEIRGFGSFRSRQRKSRVGRNPKTGDRVEVPAKRIPYFKPSKELRDLVNNPRPHATTHVPAPETGKAGRESETDPPSKNRNDQEQSL